MMANPHCVALLLCRLRSGLMIVSTSLSMLADVFVTTSYASVFLEYICLLLSLY